MKTILQPIVILISILLFSECVPIEEKKERGEQDIEALEAKITEFNEAFIKSDIEKLKMLITDNYVHTNGKSKSIKKEDWLIYLEGRKRNIESGKLVISSYEMNELEITMLTNAAIVTAKVKSSGLNESNFFENEFRVTNVWVKEDHNWKRAGFHDTKIK